MACFVQWRVVTIRNNATTGVRDLLVDGVVVPGSATLASPESIGDNATLRLVPDASCVLAEVVVWRVALSDAEVKQTVPCHREKWSVANLSGAALTAGPVVSHPGLVSVPISPPVNGMVLWLDAAYSGSLMSRETTGGAPSLMGGYVGRWASRVNGQQQACTFASPAVWSCPGPTPLGWARSPRTIASTQWARHRPCERDRRIWCVYPEPGRVCDGPSGRTHASLLTEITEATGWTVAAVWRVRTGSTAHPFAVGAAQFGDTAWMEGLGVDSPRTVMPDIKGTPLAVVNGTACLAIWDFDPTRTLALRWAVVTDAGKVYACAGSVTESGWRAGTSPLVRGTLDLAELLVWRRPLTTTEQFTVIRDYLGSKWGLNGTSLLQSVPVSLPSPPISPTAYPNASTVLSAGGTVNASLTAWSSDMMSLWDDPTTRGTKQVGHWLVYMSGRIGVNNAMRGPVDSQGLTLNTAVTPLSNLPAHNRTFTYVFRLHRTTTINTRLFGYNTQGAHGGLSFLWAGGTTWRLDRTQNGAGTWSHTVRTGTALAVETTHVLTFSVQGSPSQVGRDAYRTDATQAYCRSLLNTGSVVASSNNAASWLDPASLSGGTFQASPSAAHFGITVFRMFQTDGVLSDAQMLNLNTQMLTDWAPLPFQATYSMPNGRDYRDFNYQVNGVVIPEANVNGALLQGGSGMLTNGTPSTASWNDTRLTPPGAIGTWVGWYGVNVTITVRPTQASQVVWMHVRGAWSLPDNPPLPSPTRAAGQSSPPVRCSSTVWSKRRSPASLLGGWAGWRSSSPRG